MTKKLRIGVDFDGVIADTTPIEIEFVKERYGIELSSKDVIGARRIALLGKKSDKEISDALYGNGILTMNCNPTQNCKEILTRLTSEGHKIVIVTARWPEGTSKIKAFLKKNEIPYNHITSAKAVSAATISKRKFLERGLATFRESHGVTVAEKGAIIESLNLDVLIDDMPKHLIHAQQAWKVGVPVKLFLFDAPYNKDINLEGVQRVYGWKDLYVKLEELSKQGIAA